MVVIDSSALIPLARVGRLDLISDRFGSVRTTQEVQDEVLVEGQPGTTALQTFLDDVSIESTPADAEKVAEMEGVAVADASVLLLAHERSEVLLANDKGLIEVGKALGVDCWWVTTLLLRVTKDGTLSGDEASDLLYNLVDNGMNLHPKVYARVLAAIEDLDS